MRGIRPTGGFLRDTRVEAIFEPADIDEYRKLITAPFSMPSRPLVLAYVQSFDEVCWPLMPYREATVMLAVNLGRTPGWHSLTMPVTSRLARYGGRARGGFPKEMAEVQLVRQNGEVTGIARQGDVTLLEMRLSNATPADSDSIELPDLFNGVPAFHVVPPDGGSKVVATTLDVIEPPSVQGVRGMVQLGADPKVRWAPLLPRETPGASYVRQGAFILRFGRFAAQSLSTLSDARYRVPAA